MGRMMNKFWHRQLQVLGREIKTDFKTEIREEVKELEKEMIASFKQLPASIISAIVHW